MPRKHSDTLSASNARLAKTIWPALSRAAFHKLCALSEENRLSLPAGDITYLESGWYVTHSGLLRLARRNRCAGIDVRPLNKFCDPATSRWAFKAIVYKSATCKGFVGYGDADPSNVSPLVRGAEMRVAETRAVNRALRKAYGIGICSVEEIGSLPARSQPEPNVRRLPPQPANGDGQPKLRDQLCLLIRQHRLDASMVKQYAAEFCGTKDLRQASREQVASFIKHIAEFAARDREGLLVKLNSFAQQAGAA
jgi:hypothetical protein